MTSSARNGKGDFKVSCCGCTNISQSQFVCPPFHTIKWMKTSGDRCTVGAHQKFAIGRNNGERAYPTLSMFWFWFPFHFGHICLFFVSAVCLSSVYSNVQRSTFNKRRNCWLNMLFDVQLLAHIPNAWAKRTYRNDSNNQRDNVGRFGHKEMRRRSA